MFAIMNLLSWYTKTHAALVDATWVNQLYRNTKVLDPAISEDPTRSSLVYRRIHRYIRYELSIEL